MLLSHFNNPIEFLGILLAFLIAITVHEFAHGYVADRLGDPTARVMGRLTLNPLAHLDLFGSLMILFAPFGWAKPVPIDPFNLRHPRKDTALISLAGPAANLLTAGLFAGIIHLLLLTSGVLSTISIQLFTMVVILNVNLAIFNLIPIHPFDGFAIVRGILPEEAARQWQQLEGLGMIMILLLVFPLFGSSPILSLLSPVVSAITNLLLPF